jgi:hypothetical protein
MYAVLVAIKDNHVYLAGQKFRVETDHIANSFLERMKASSGRLGRWAVQLSPYKFEIVYKKGASLPHADALSRRVYPPDEPKTTYDSDEDEDAPFLHNIQLTPADVSDELLCLTITNDFEPSSTKISADDATLFTTVIEPTLVNVSDLQAQCNDCRPMIDYLLHGILPTDDAKARKLVLESDAYCIKQNVLHHIYYSKGKRLHEAEPCHFQLVVPTQLRPQIFQAYHTDNCHAGFDKTYATIRLKYWWPRMYIQLEEYIKTCDICQRAKRPVHHHRAPMGSVGCEKLLSRFHADHIGPFPVSNGYKYVLVFIESMSLYCELIPTVGTGVNEVVDALQDVIIPRYGCPVRILTDRHASFASRLYEAVTKIFKISQVKTSSLHPETNNRCEQFNSCLLRSLRVLTENQSNWSSLLPAVALSHRATVTTSNGFSPFELMYGQPMRLPIDTSIINDVNTTPDVDAYMRELIEKIQVTREAALSNNASASERAKFYHDFTAQWPRYQLGDEVLLYQPPSKKGICKKLYRQWRGPFIIEECFDNYTYKIRELASGKVMKSHIHSNRLRPYRRRKRVLHQSVPPVNHQSHASAPPIMVPNAPISSSSSSSSPANTDTNADAGPSARGDLSTQSPIVNDRLVNNQWPSSQLTQTLTQTSTTNANDNAPPLPDGWFKIQRLLSKRKFGGKDHYLVLWEDNSKSYEPASNISDEAIAEFKSRTKNRRRRRV